MAPTGHSAQDGLPAVLTRCLPDVCHCMPAWSSRAPPQKRPAKVSTRLPPAGRLVRAPSLSRRIPDELPCALMPPSHRSARCSPVPCRPRHATKLLGHARPQPNAWTCTLRLVDQPWRPLVQIQSSDCDGGGGERARQAVPAPGGGAGGGRGRERRRERAAAADARVQARALPGGQAAGARDRGLSALLPWPDVCPCPCIRAHMP